MKIAGIILLVVQVLSIIGTAMAGDNIFDYPFPNLIGRFIFGIVGIVLLVIYYKRKREK